ncbi:MAG: (2Fe-2S)-binding protein [Chloroflexi bacterium RBG_16_50_9]|nr:MAG: (2Fe-2S)-binding protein [Chloroflexi bacterium RBG_16_50_9]
MGNFIKAGKSVEFQDGAMKKVPVKGREILVARVEGNYYAADNRCPHMGGDLSLGKLEGTIVTCPRHSSRFDLKDGKLIRWMKGSGLFYTVGKVLKSPRPLPVCNVKVEGDDVLVEI